MSYFFVCLVTGFVTSDVGFSDPQDGLLGVIFALSGCSGMVELRVFCVVFCTSSVLVGFAG